MPKINRSVSSVIVLAATDYTSNTTVTAATLSGMLDYHSISFLCKFSATGSDAGDRLQVFIQRSGNDNIKGQTATWDDIAASTEHTESSIGNGSDLFEWINITSNIEPGTSDDVYTEAADALTAATTKDVPWGGYSPCEGETNRGNRPEH